MRIRGWTILGLSAILTAALISATFCLFGFTEPAIRLLVRNTARISVTLFLLAFVASALHTLFRAPWSRYVLVNRRYIGVSFALVHTAHLLLLIALLRWYPHPFTDALKPVTVIGGGLAYIFIGLMTLTSFDVTAALIGRRAWRILHTVGAYYIWILFAQSYLPRAWNDVWYAPFAFALLAGIGLRLYVLAVKRQRIDTAAVMEQA